MTQDIAEQLLAGDRGATARAISAVENDAPEAGAVLRAIHAHIGRARVLGITGPPGAGKSTLTSALIGECLKRGQRVAVVAVDPSSPISGGAILGDRIRMGDHQSDERVFIRSVASRGYPGGLSRTASRVIDVLDAAGYGVVIVETVGAGQSDVEIGLLADTRVVICPAGLGDGIQAIKSGLLEIADIYAVNKADSPFAQRTQDELAGMIAMRVREYQRINLADAIDIRPQAGLRSVAQVEHEALATGFDDKTRGPLRAAAGNRDQSGFAPDALMTLAHFFTSAAR